MVAKNGKKGNLTTFIKDEHVKYSDNQTDILFNFDFPYLGTKAEQFFSTAVSKPVFFLKTYI